MYFKWVFSSFNNVVESYFNVWMGKYFSGWKTQVVALCLDFLVGRANKVFNKANAKWFTKSSFPKWEDNKLVFVWYWFTSPYGFIVFYFLIWGYVFCFNPGILPDTIGGVIFLMLKSCGIISCAWCAMPKPLIEESGSSSSSSDGEEEGAVGGAVGPGVEGAIGSDLSSLQNIWEGIGLSSTPNPSLDAISKNKLTQDEIEESYLKFLQDQQGGKTKADVVPRFGNNLKSDVGVTSYYVTTVYEVMVLLYQHGNAARLMKVSDDHYFITFVESTYRKVDTGATSNLFGNSVGVQANPSLIDGYSDVNPAASNAVTDVLASESSLSSGSEGRVVISVENVEIIEHNISNGAENLGSSKDGSEGLPSLSWDGPSLSAMKSMLKAAVGEEGYNLVMDSVGHDDTRLTSLLKGISLDESSLSALVKGLSLSRSESCPSLPDTSTGDDSVFIHDSVGKDSDSAGPSGISPNNGVVQNPENWRDYRVMEYSSETSNSSDEALRLSNPLESGATLQRWATENDVSSVGRGLDNLDLNPSSSSLNRSVSDTDLLYEQQKQKLKKGFLDELLKGKPISSSDSNLSNRPYVADSVKEMVEQMEKGYKSSPDLKIPEYVRSVESFNSVAESPSQITNSKESLVDKTKGVNSGEEGGSTE